MGYYENALTDFVERYAADGRMTLYFPDDAPPSGLLDALAKEHPHLSRGEVARIIYGVFLNAEGILYDTVDDRLNRM